MPPRRRSRLRWVVVVALVAVVAAVAVTLRLTGGAEPVVAAAPSDVVASQQAASAAVLPTECASAAELVPQRAMRCDLLPYHPDRPTIVLWGDSHAWQLVPAMEAAIGGREVNLVGFLFGACPLVSAPGVRTECARTNNLALNFVRRATAAGQPVRLVVSEAWELYREGLSVGETNLPINETIRGAARLTVAGTPRLFSELADLGVGVDVVAPLPVVPTDVDGCTDLQPGVPTTCLLPRSAALGDEDANLAQINALLSGLTDADLIDPSISLCDHDSCAAVIEGTPVFLDKIHLSAEMSRRLGDYFEPSVEELLNA